jgi:3-phosphoshikimate 1-carboxyvinyltransferase
LDGLCQLGVSAKSMRGDGYAPVIIQGPLKIGTTVVNGEDSQPVSALLIASAFAEGPVDIIVKNPGEQPWVNVTLNWFERLGISYQNHSFEKFRLFGGAQYEGFQYAVPGDFSSAAYPIAAALITQSELLLKNVDMSDSQGDKELISVFQKMGARIDIDETRKTIHVKKGGSLSGIVVDINHFIDSITILAVVACFAEGETHIQNAAVAKQKECNRIQCISTELQKMGANISETEDGLMIKKSTLTGTNLHSYHDHRMVMSLAVAAMGAEGMATISPIDCVAKTFPTFMQDFARLGASIQERS